MPADHQLTQAVLAVLAGTPASQAAALARTTPAALDEATEAFISAGQAALSARTEHDWYHASARFPNWTEAETTATSSLGPALRRLQHDGIITSWWFIRKHPCWRLRLRPADLGNEAAISRTFDNLAASRAISQWQPGIYEPETAAFGGPPGITIAHDLHCADTDSFLGYLALADPVLGRREISMLLCKTMLHAAGLDTFEQADTWHRVAQLRPDTKPASGKLARQLHGLMTRPITPRAAIFGSGSPLAYAAPWATAFSHAGTQLRNAAACGTLQRGLRNILAHIIIFHWNRLAISTTTQATLARTAAQTLLPP